MTQCKHFIVDTIGFGAGIGDCQKLVDYKAKGATEAEIENVKRKYLIGSHCFWYDNCNYNYRNCLRYEPIEENHES